MQIIAHHLRRNAGFYSALALGAVAVWVIFEGIVFGRVRALGIGRGYITSAEDPAQFYGILLGAVAMLALCVWAGISHIRIGQAIKRNIR